VVRRAVTADEVAGAYPVFFDVEYPGRLSLLLIFVKWAVTGGRPTRAFT
jgi:hypothetical protein